MPIFKEWSHILKVNDAVQSSLMRYSYAVHEVGALFYNILYAYNLL